MNATIPTETPKAGPISCIHFGTPRCLKCPAKMPSPHPLQLMWSYPQNPCDLLWLIRTYFSNKILFHLNCEDKWSLKMGIPKPQLMRHIDACSRQMCEAQGWTWIYQLFKDGVKFKQKTSLFMFMLRSTNRAWAILVHNAHVGIQQALVLAKALSLFSLSSKNEVRMFVQFSALSHHLSSDLPLGFCKFGIWQQPAVVVVGGQWKKCTMCLGSNLKGRLQLRRNRRCGLRFVLQARNLRCFGFCDLGCKILDHLFSVSFSGGCIQLKMLRKAGDLRMGRKDSVHMHALDSHAAHSLVIHHVEWNGEMCECAENAYALAGPVSAPSFLHWTWPWVAKSCSQKLLGCTSFTCLEIFPAQPFRQRSLLCWPWAVTHKCKASCAKQT